MNSNRKIGTRILAVGAGLAALAAVLTAACSGGSKSAPAAPAADHASHGASSAEVTFQADMRKLWEDHITWTRLAIISIEAGAPDTSATVDRLMQNQVDIGNAIKPFYGNDAGDKLTALLKDHISIAADILTAAKAGDAAKVQVASDRWNANADEIAAFLSSANPTAWPVSDMKKMMHDHLDLTLAEAVDHLKGNYAADVADYDKVHAEILSMADMLSAGIINQFPQKFS